jgi:bifunctional N-acetylglucosamine-1-phosphate-uridyltransferase/glucosamine-1-phosphate-acetyltransferase GlmU-like protein
MAETPSLSAVILAAGKGTRLKMTDSNKVVTSLGGRPMIAWTVERLQKFGVEDVVVVTGFAANSVRRVLGNTVRYVDQAEQWGTGHATQVGLTAIISHTTDVLVLYGDHSAFYTPEFYQRLWETHQREHNAMTMVAMTYESPSELGWGRVVRGSDGSVTAIVEEKECTPEQKLISELNAGCYIFRKEVLQAGLPTLQVQSGGEYYLTDMVAYCVSHQQRVGALLATTNEVGIGVNTAEQWESAQELFNRLFPL